MPDFDQLLTVLANKKPDRPVLFEFMMNDQVHLHATGLTFDNTAPHFQMRLWAQGFAALGYDYATFGSWHLGFGFKTEDRERAASVSINEGGLIKDEASFAAYEWPDPAQANYALIEELAPELAPGMRFIGMGPNGVLENAIGLVGYEDLCLALADEEDWVEEVFARVGAGLLGYYQRLVEQPSIGALIVNDDWGFAQQTMLSPSDLRRLVFPWHKRIVQCIHDAGKPAILHSCGNFSAVIDDVIDDLAYDARHSYEDNTIPVETAYDTWGPRIAILGGIDVDFVCRQSPEAITKRALAMLERSEARGGYALGTGNSVPEYVPTKNFLALIEAAKRVSS